MGYSSSHTIISLISIFLNIDKQIKHTYNHLLITTILGQAGSIKLPSLIVPSYFKYGFNVYRNYPIVTIFLGLNCLPNTFENPSPPSSKYDNVTPLYILSSII